MGCPNCNEHQGVCSKSKRGPQGPRGPKGDRGPQGPPGVSGSSSITRQHVTEFNDSPVTNSNWHQPFSYNMSFVAAKTGQARIHLEVSANANDAPGGSSIIACTVSEGSIAPTVDESTALASFGSVRFSFITNASLLQTGVILIDVVQGQTYNLWMMLKFGDGVNLVMCRMLIEE